jgi:hypothetical protein
VNYRRLSQDFLDDIVMEHGVSYDTARVLFMMWLVGMKHWERKCDALLDYLLKDQS